MKFTQHIVVEVDDLEALQGLLSEWQASEAAQVAGYLGGRLLSFRDKPGRYVLAADFASFEDAEANNGHPDTQAWAARLQSIIRDEPKYENLDVLAEF